MLKWLTRFWKCTYAQIQKGPVSRPRAHAF